MGFFIGLGMKVYYVANARMPNAKAHGIQIAKMCEAFIRLGMDLTLVVPSRGDAKASMQEFYGLSVPVTVKRLSVPDLFLFGSVLYRVASVLFMIRYTIFLWWKKLSGERFIVYTVDLDNYSSSLLPLAGVPLYSEMHGGKKDTLEQRYLFAHASGIIATTPITRDELKQTFPKTNARFCVEPNGVDPERFIETDKLAARRTLELPADARIALYAGRFFAWKGLELIPEAARKTDGTLWYMVGGSKGEFMRITGIEQLPDTMHFLGDRPHDEIPLWLSAADALVVLGTKRDTQSYRWTSPMKLFEYLLAKRPIIAAKTPAIESVVSEQDVLFYEPDDAASLADAVSLAVSGRADPSLLTRAEAKGRTLTWDGRAKRIEAFIEDVR